MMRWALTTIMLSGLAIDVGQAHSRGMRRRSPADRPTHCPRRPRAALVADQNQGRQVNGNARSRDRHSPQSSMDASSTTRTRPAFFLVELNPRPEPEQPMQGGGRKPRGFPDCCVGRPSRSRNFQPRDLRCPTTTLVMAALPVPGPPVIMATQFAGRFHSFALFLGQCQDRAARGPRRRRSWPGPAGNVVEQTVQAGGNLALNTVQIVQKDRLPDSLFRQGLDDQALALQGIDPVSSIRSRSWQPEAGPSRPDSRAADTYARPLGNLAQAIPTRPPAAGARPERTEFESFSSAVRTRFHWML